MERFWHERCSWVANTIVIGGQSFRRFTESVSLYGTQGSSIPSVNGLIPDDRGLR